MKYVVYTDGGARGNPGIAGCGIFIVDAQGHPIERRYKAIGRATNNQAEYTAALLGITRAIELGATELDLRCDSLLVIEQLSGRYKIKNPELKSIYLEIKKTLSEWGGHIGFTHVYREENREADRLSNLAMDLEFHHEI